MWHILKTTLRTDPTSIEYFGPFPTIEQAEEFEQHAFDADDVEVEHIKMFEVDGRKVK